MEQGENMTCKSGQSEFISPPTLEVVNMKKYIEILKTYIEQYPANAEDKEPGLLPAHIFSSTY